MERNPDYTDEYNDDLEAIENAGDDFLIAVGLTILVIAVIGCAVVLIDYFTA